MQNYPLKRDIDCENMRHHLCSDYSDKIVIFVFQKKANGLHSDLYGKTFSQYFWTSRMCARALVILHHQSNVKTFLNQILYLKKTSEWSDMVFVTNTSVLKILITNVWKRWKVKWTFRITYFKIFWRKWFVKCLHHTLPERVLFCFLHSLRPMYREIVRPNLGQIHPSRDGMERERHAHTRRPDMSGLRTVRVLVEKEF